MERQSKKTEWCLHNLRSARDRQAPHPQGPDLGCKLAKFIGVNSENRLVMLTSEGTLNFSTPLGSQPFSMDSSRARTLGEFPSRSILPIYPFLNFLVIPFPLPGWPDAISSTGEEMVAPYSLLQLRTVSLLEQSQPTPTPQPPQKSHFQWIETIHH